jgi:hypothetical protein
MSPKIFEIISTLVEIAGAALIVTGVFLLNVPAGFIVSGIATLALSYFATRSVVSE